jgi:hypothetical protein
VRDIAFFVREIFQPFTKPAGVSLLAIAECQSAILGLTQVIMLAELVVNRVLDNLELPAHGFLRAH